MTHATTNGLPSGSSAKGSNPRVALVTGAGSGIGRATARKLASQGYTVACVDLSGDSVQETAAGLVGAIGIRCDVTKEADVVACIEHAIKHYGRLDVVVNNAGITSRADVEQEPTENFDKVMAVNARGTFLVSKYAMRHLRATRGCIVNVASITAMVGRKGGVAYCASKSAIMGLTRAMAVDHIGEGIRVNAVCPGGVDTPLVARYVSQAKDPDELAKQVKARYLPMGRMATPEEIASAIAYLASDDAGFITGTGLVIDGGILMQ